MGYQLGCFIMVCKYVINVCVNKDNITQYSVVLQVLVLAIIPANMYNNSDIHGVI